MKTEEAVKKKIKVFTEFVKETNANIGFEIEDRHVAVPKTYLRIWWFDCMKKSHSV
jgi:hypothetical protein